MIIGVVIVLGLLTVGLYMSYQQKDRIKNKRTYIFEKDDGQRYNPFNSIDEGASEDGWKYSEDDFR